MDAAELTDAICCKRLCTADDRGTMAWGLRSPMGKCMTPDLAVSAAESDDTRSGDKPGIPAACRAGVKNVRCLLCGSEPNMLVGLGLTHGRFIRTRPYQAHFGMTCIVGLRMSGSDCETQLGWPPCTVPSLSSYHPCRGRSPSPHPSSRKVITSRHWTPSSVRPALSIDPRGRFRHGRLRQHSADR